VSEAAHALYRMLPYPAKILAASAHGYRLRRWRYGPETDRLVGEAIERDGFSPDKWKAWQAERLAPLLHRAATTVPFYRQQWTGRRQAGDRARWDELANWPLLSKESVRANPGAFVADDRDVRKLYLVETSGTTGKPLRLWRPRETERRWFALIEARLRIWNGVSRQDRWSICGGQRVTSGDRRRPPFWVWNHALHQLYLSSYHVSPANVPAYIAALARHGIRYMLGYPSALAALANGVIERGLSPSPTSVILSNAEPLLDRQRDVIGRAFRAPVRDTYGQAEMVAAASECAAGSMHLWPDVGVAEWLVDDADAPVEPVRVGRLVSTGLLNEAMPLVRYEMGDRGFAADSAAVCACGRLLPVLKGFEGRTADLLFTPAGSPVGGLDTIFHSGLHMREAQIVQERRNLIRIRVVPAAGFSDADRLDMRKGVQVRLGADVEVVVDVVDEIARTAAGKFRVQVCELGAEERGVS
jgi:phenylacetate-CoA ligase